MLRDLWSSGVEPKEIATLLGKNSRKIVCGKAHDLGLGDHPAHPIIRWTPENDQKLIRLRGTLFGAKEIAAEMGCSLSAVNNRINKLRTKGTALPEFVYKGRNQEEAAEEFWRHVLVTEDEDQCWVWNRAFCCKGYGKAGFQVGPLDPDTRAHRVAFYLANGFLPEAPLLIRHSCDNPPCCNPKHLLSGTHTDNMQDMIKRGRAAWQASRHVG